MVARMPTDRYLSTIDAGGGYAEHYTSMPYGHHKYEVYSLFGEIIAALALGSPRILDVGAGPAHLALEYHRARPQAQATWTALDASSDLLAIASERFAATPRRMTTTHRSFTDPHWSDGLGPFDVVVSNNALMFLPPEAIGGFYRSAHALCADDAILLNQQTFTWNDGESPYGEGRVPEFMRSLPFDILRAIPATVSDEERRRLKTAQRDAVKRNQAEVDAARARGIAIDASSYHFVTVDRHLSAMRDAGFDAACIWRKREFAIVLGIKGQPPMRR
jgi:SAM-dependent methyltransferase